MLKVSSGKEGVSHCSLSPLPRVQSPSHRWPLVPGELPTSLFSPSAGEEAKFVSFDLYPDRSFQRRMDEISLNQLLNLA